MNAIFEHILLAAGVVFATSYLLSLCFLVHNAFVDRNSNL